MPFKPQTRALICCITAVFCVSVAFAKPAAAPQPQLAFRNTDVQLKAAPATVAPETAAPAAPGETITTSQEKLDQLAEQKQSMESEMRYAQAKLDGARKKLAVSIAANNQESIDAANRDVHDWSVRVQNCQSQLAQIDTSLQSAIGQMEGPGGGKELLLPGDNVEVYVAEDSSFNGKYPIRRGGYIILPQVGRIYVAGSDFDGAERTIRKALEASQLTHATVTVEKLAGNDVESGPVIYLSGEFRSTHPFRIPPGTSPTVVSVLLSCGGFTEHADLRHVKVMRVAGGKGVTEEINVQNILDGTAGAGLTSDLRLNDGDVLMIPANQASMVYLTGNVKKQGIQPIGLNSKLTCYAAILNAGGFARFAKEAGVYILRENADGTKTKIPVNVKDIKAGKMADVPLVGNDIIVVPEKWFSL